MLLELKGIKKHFPVGGGFFGLSRDVVRAVDGIDLSVNSGENISLVGESGCGKTTLARIIMKLIEQDEGEIHFDGSNISKLPNSRLKSVRKKMQMVFQDPYSSLDPRFTIGRIMKEGFTLDQGGFKDDNDKMRHTENMLQSVQLRGGLLNRFPHEFSGGERQRIAIARALILNPKLLVLDEAVSSLDVIIQRQIIDLLAELQDQFKLTYLFISHNLKIVRKISHRIAVMYRGKIVELAPSEAIFNNPIHPYTKELLSAALEYKVTPREKEINIDPNAKIMDHGGGHWVMGY